MQPSQVVLLKYDHQAGPACFYLADVHPLLRQGCAQNDSRMREGRCSVLSPKSSSRKCLGIKNECLGWSARRTFMLLRRRFLARSARAADDTGERFVVPKPS